MDLIVALFCRTIEALRAHESPLVSKESLSLAVPRSSSWSEMTKERQKMSRRIVYIGEL